MQSTIANIGPLPATVRYDKSLTKKSQILRFRHLRRYRYISIRKIIQSQCSDQMLDRGTVCNEKYRE